MHRILLYALVIALLYLAWDARRGEVLAGEKQAGWLGPFTLEARALPPDVDPASAANSQTSAPELDPRLQARLEARVEARPDVWAKSELEAPAGPPAEEVLAEAEAWMEARFPEGGSTEKNPALVSAKMPRAAGSESVEFDPRELREGESQTDPKTKKSEDPGDDPEPIYVASLARIESLSGDLPAWCGLLDLALQPAGRRSFLAAEGNPDALAEGDTAWISDDRGRLIARVEALDGFGLELDPTWPWVARQRRLYWNEFGVGGLPARQFRLVLQGNGFVPSWSGRLMLIHSRASAPPTQR